MNLLPSNTIWVAVQSQLTSVYLLFPLGYCVIATWVLIMVFCFSENQRGVLGLVQIVTAILCVFDFVLHLLLLVCLVGMLVGEKEKKLGLLFSPAFVGEPKWSSLLEF
jgi:hypothetical protein